MPDTALATVPRMAALDLPAQWPVGAVAAGFADADGRVETTGDPARRWRVASITKLLTATAILVAVEEGTVALEEPEPAVPGATVRHLLAHTSGLPFEGSAPVAEPGRRRIYSNTGFEILGAHLAERAAMPFADYLAGAVLEPLELRATGLDDGSPAAGVWSSLDDILRFGRELLAPTLVAAATFAEATTVQFPGLAGILPGFGRHDPCDWGLGFELRDHKQPHWTGRRNSPATFGHFGGAGTFLWIDPVAGVACAALTDRGFDSWAAEVWPPFSDAVLAELDACR